MTEKQAMPWDFFDKSIGRVSFKVSSKRMSVCKECPSLLPTRNCAECGCFMSIKTKLPNAFCPLGKWGQEEKDTNVE